MADPDNEWGLSLVARQFIAGQLRHARSIYALLAPTVNCLKRRRTHTFSPTNVSWGLEGRSAFVRVKGGSIESKHVENRAPTGLAHPYLATATLLGAGPTTVDESLALLEEGDQIVDLLGDEFVRVYTTIRSTSGTYVLRTVLKMW